jgi:hypothetical protein
MSSSGTFRIPLISMIDRELLLQRGETLRGWADNRGISFSVLIDALKGQGRNPGTEDLLNELAQSLGISLSAFHDWRRTEAMDSVPAPA